MTDYRTLSQRMDDAIAELLALREYAKRRLIVARLKRLNRGRIMEWRGTSPRARRKMQGRRNAN